MDPISIIVFLLVANLFFGVSNYVKLKVLGEINKS